MSRNLRMLTVVLMPVNACEMFEKGNWITQLKFLASRLEGMLARADTAPLPSYENVDLADNAVFAFGFSPSEKQHRWTTGSRSLIRFDCKNMAVGNTKGYTFEIDCWPFLARGPRQGQRVLVNVNGCRVAKWNVTTRARHSIAISKEALQGSRYCEIDLELPDAISPKAAGLSADARELAIAVSVLSFREQKSEH